MQILSITVNGLRDLPKCTIDEIQGSTHFQGPNPACSALADAISFWFAALEHGNLVFLLNTWGWADDQIEATVAKVVGDHYPEQAFWEDGLLPSLWVEEARNFSVTLTVALSAKQIGKIRTSTKDPSVLISLMERPELTMTMSALFTNDFRAMAISKSDIFIGDYEVPLERPYWLQGFLQTLSVQFYRNYNHFAVADRAMLCALSIEHFSAYEAFQEACKDYGDLRVAFNSNNKPIFLIDEYPIERWGWSMENKLRDLASVYLFSADIVWIDDWSGSSPKGVQVFSTSPNGNRIIELNNPKRSLQFPITQ